MSQIGELQQYISGFRGHNCHELRQLMCIMNKITKLDQGNQVLTTYIDEVVSRIKKNKNAAFVSYFTNKIKQLGIKCQPCLIQNQNHNKMVYELNKMRPQEIEKIPDFKCIGCCQFIYKGFSVNPYFQLQDQAPCLLNEIQIIQDLSTIRNGICALANQGGGFMLLASKIKDNYILEGFKNFTNEEQSNIKNKLDQATKSIIDYQSIGIKVQTIPLKAIEGDIASCKQCVLRIQVIVMRKKSQVGFYTIFKPKPYKKQYQTYILERQSLNGYSFWTVTQAHNKYQLIFKIAFNYKYFSKIICKCLSRFQNGISIQLGEYKKVATNFVNPQKYFISIFNDSVAKNNKIYFPEISQQSNIVIFKVKQNSKISQEIRLKMTKQFTNIKYQVPMRQFQMSWNKIKHQKQNKQVYCFQMYTIQADSKKISDQLQRIFKDENQICYQIVSKKMMIAHSFEVPEIQLLRNLIFNEFGAKPTFTSKSKSLKNQVQLHKIDIEFSSRHLNIAAFVAVILNMSDLRIKFL